MHKVERQSVSPSESPPRYHTSAPPSAPEDIFDVAPHHVCGVSFICQRQAAYIANSLHGACAAGRTDEVAFRGQQARRGYQRAVLEGAALGCGLVYRLVQGVQPLDAIQIGFMALLIGIDAGNAYRHSQTYRVAEQSLILAVGDAKRAVQILAIDARKNNIEPLATALEANNVAAQALRHANGWYPSKRHDRSFCTAVWNADCSSTNASAG